MGDRTDTADGTASLQREARRYTHSWYQYGALGLIVMFFFGVVIYLMHIFVPIFVHRFEQDEVAQTQQTVAIQKVASAMETIISKLDDNLATLRSTATVTPHRR